MSDFTAKMHQIPFRPGLCPRPRRGAYSARPDLLAGGLEELSEFALFLSTASNSWQFFRQRRVEKIRRGRNVYNFDNSSTHFYDVRQ